MSGEGFALDESSGLWIPENFQGVEWADGSELFLQQTLEEAPAVTDYPVELAGFIHDWPSRYHLSHVRVNFLEALRSLVQPDWNALELGGGTGIITKWLAGVVAHVDVMEGSITRARINRTRTRQDSNVRVYVGDMVSTPFPATYDLVTLIGVLEYTPAGAHGTRREACLDLLKKIRESLTSDGVLMLAIENRLGAKYWAGCGEDHSTRLFDGIMGYPDDTPVTFSRNELQDLLGEAGFGHQQFYHLHPDYKMPTTVIRETDFPKDVALHQWTMGFAEDYMAPRKYLMPDPLLMKSAEDAGLFWHFSNSFLVLCSTSSKPRLAVDWMVRRVSNSLRSELHHTTTLVEREDGLRIEREPLRSGSSRHCMGDLIFELSSDTHTTGSLMLTEVYQALVSSDWYERLYSLCQELLHFARANLSAGASSQHGPFDLLNGAALDLTFWNVMRRQDGSLDFFDRKWTSAVPIAADYVLFRNLLWLQWWVSAAAKTDVRAIIIDLLTKMWPSFDEARFAEHLLKEEHLQSSVHAGLHYCSALDAEGHLVMPWSAPRERSAQPLPKDLQRRIGSGEDPVALLREVLSSTSWRLTKPIRTTGQTIRSLRAGLRRLSRPS
jgi:hypothetical protein